MKLAHLRSGSLVLLFLACTFFTTEEGAFASQVIIWGDNTYGQTNSPIAATNALALAAGDYHCLTLNADGTVLAWGRNSSGQVSVPSDLTNAISVAAGSTHSLALKSDGTVVQWGLMGFGATSIPATATSVVALALGPSAQHALVLRADGMLLDWGNPFYSLTNIPPAASNATSIAAGGTHALALRSDGRVVAWGNNGNGQLNVPAAATNIVAIAAGSAHSAALRANGTVLTWGSASPGSIQPPFGLTNVVDIACGDNHIVALKRDGSVVAWGFNGSGQINVPKSATNITAIAAGGSDTLALAGTGPPMLQPCLTNLTVDSGSTAYLRMRAVGALPLSYQWSCNGTNLPGATNSILTLTNVQPGQTGNLYYLTVSNQFGVATGLPVRLSELPLEVSIQPANLATVIGATAVFTAVTLGQGPFVYQWQHDGLDLTAATNAVLSLTNLQPADAGNYSVVASNIFGAAGAAASLTVAPTIITNALQAQSTFPGGTVSFSIGLQAVLPITYQWQFNGVAIAAATNYSLTISNAHYDQAGLYTVIFSDAYENVTNSAPLSVVPIAAWGDMNQSQVAPTLTNLIAISAGERHALTLDADGAVFGWGVDLHGETMAPVELSNVVAISAGNGGNLALKGDGTVIAWGYNAYGQTNVPAGLTNVVAISAGDFHNMVLKADGTVIAWGNDTYGQTNVPAGLSNVVAIAAGEWNSMALKSDGTVIAWGAGTNNTESDPNFGQSSVPRGVSNVVQIATGSPDDFALLDSGSLIGWGGNFYGEDTPPAGLSNVVAFAAGYGHTVALKANGNVAVWGYNAFGETNVPVGLTNVVAVSARGFHSLALVGTGPPASHVQLSSYKWVSDGFSISLPSRSGKVYNLEYKNSLDATNWAALPLVPGSGRSITLTDTSSTNSPRRFYRVRQW